MLGGRGKYGKGQGMTGWESSFYFMGLGQGGLPPNNRQMQGDLENWGKKKR